MCLKSVLKQDTVLYVLLEPRLQTHLGVYWPLSPRNESGAILGSVCAKQNVVIEATLACWQFADLDLHPTE